MIVMQSAQPHLSTVTDRSLVYIASVGNVLEVSKMTTQTKRMENYLPLIDSIF